MLAMAIGVLFAFLRAPSNNPSSSKQVISSSVSFANRALEYSTHPDKYAHFHSAGSEMESEYYLIYDEDFGDVRAVRDLRLSRNCSLEFKAFMSDNYANIFDATPHPIPHLQTNIADETYAIDSGPLQGYTLLAYTYHGLRVTLLPQ